ncbi:gamma-glutamylcyclotransferase [Picosynechococcus sp. NKBG15041c]|uniref:gamma-glutamylcyclotransferase family protein n=1 Tax=Picosynechococcus sp. NKBG15041c TaxID=1407650 RepID=UPI0003F7F185|nr:gamma-glutamylcyclotransferase [Picosynechococcus sp. NKBG15041c]
MLKVFVYGTLQPGEVNFPRYCQSHGPQVTPALIPGQLYHLPVGYPALVPGSGWVEGCLLSFADGAVLEKLDELEDYQPGRSPAENEYQRVKALIYADPQTILTEAWVYVMTPQKIAQLGGVPFVGSRWCGLPTVG